MQYCAVSFLIVVGGPYWLIRIQRYKKYVKSDHARTFDLICRSVVRLKVHGMKRNLGLMQGLGDGASRRYDMLKWLSKQ